MKQLIGRVVDTITRWAREQEYFASEDDLQAFSDDLKHLLVYQKGSFNSPVWFNCGFEKAPQCSACFINSVQDTMESILTLAKTEGMLFKFGSGTGSNLSSIRSSREVLAGGGTASGPVSFMKGFDAFAGVIKSGGKTRRAAKMVILNADHPDIVEFINCKVEEETKAWALIDAGYDGSFTGPAYASVFFQNSNNSVRVTDEFMRAVLDDGEWQTHAVRDRRGDGHLQGARSDAADRRRHLGVRRSGHAVRHDGQRLAHLPEHGAHQREQPVLRVHVPRRLGVQPGVDQPDEVRRRVDGEFDAKAFAKACETFITAQEILVDNASYPTQGDRAQQPRLPAARPRLREPRRAADVARPAVRQRRRPRLRGGDHGRHARRGLRAVGARRARSRRAVPRLREEPRADAARDAQAPRGAQGHRPHQRAEGRCSKRAKQVWDECVELGEQHGYRNAQATVLAPTGTIGFMMDCDTTGVEPDIALVKYKKLVGGGLMKIVNNTVPMALAKLGYTPAQVKDIIDYIDENETIEGAPHLKDKDLAGVRLRVQADAAACARSTTWATSR